MVQNVHDGVEQVRCIPLAEVIPALYPGAYRSRERQGPGRVRWILPDGTKVNVLPLADGDLFRFMNRVDDHAAVPHKGAINFVMAIQNTSFREAMQALQELHPTIEPFRPDPRPTQVRATLLRHPPRWDDSEREWMLIRDYLVGERRLPDTVVADGYRRGYVYAGTGLYQDYLVFPHRAAGLSSPVTGYSLRWAGPGTPSQERPVKWVAGGSRLKEGWFTLGHSPETLIITESPIDALTLWASAIQEGVAHRVSIRSSSGAGGLTERLWQGFDAVVGAFDNDAAGQGYADWLEQHRSAGETLCLTPPEPYKDWNAAWQAGHRNFLSATRLWEREVARIQPKCQEER